jgi:hypothetical protein
MRISLRDDAPLRWPSREDYSARWPLPSKQRARVGILPGALTCGNAVSWARISRLQRFCSRIQRFWPRPSGHGR